MSQADEKRMGRQLQMARQTAGLTQQVLCQKAGLSYSTLAKIERGAIKSPSIFTIQHIASALGMSLDDLVGHTAAPAVIQRQRSKSGVSFVYFDINGCLVRFYHRAFTRVAIDSGQAPDVVETAFWHYNDQVCRGEMPITEFNKALAKHLGLPIFAWEAYYLQAAEIMPGVRELVEWVSKHYGVGLLTNIMPGQIADMRRQGLIPDMRYDVIVDSSEVHAIKPERKIYEIAEERAGCTSSEILFIDDGRINLMAAEKLGWHVMWFDDAHPDESVARIRETLELATD